MSNCLAYNTLTYTKRLIDEPPVVCSVIEVRLGDYVMNVNQEFQKVCEIKYFENIDCIEFMDSIIFSKDHFSEINFKKLVKFSEKSHFKINPIREIIFDVIAFYCENNKYIEVVPYNLRELFV